MYTHKIVLSSAMQYYNLHVIRKLSKKLLTIKSVQKIHLVYKGKFLKIWSKVLQTFLLFSLYFSSLNLKYLKFTKMELTRFAMKLFI